MEGRLVKLRDGILRTMGSMSAKPRISRRIAAIAESCSDSASRMCSISALCTISWYRFETSIHAPVCVEAECQGSGSKAHLSVLMTAKIVSSLCTEILLRDQARISPVHIGGRCSATTIASAQNLLRERTKLGCTLTSIAVPLRRCLTTRSKRTCVYACSCV